jgi:putative hydrolase of the HAD superfamily
MGTQSFQGAVLALDVDGVLLNSSPPGRGTWQHVLEQKYGVRAADLQSTFFEQAWPDIMVGRLNIESPLEAALTSLGWPCTAEEFLADWFEADFVFNDEVVEAALTWTSDGAKLVIVTNQEHRRATYLLERFSAFFPVSSMAYSAEVGHEKRTPEFLQVADTMFGTTEAPSSVVLLDDTMANVEGARAHGWQSVHFTGQPGWRDEVEEALAAASTLSTST